MQTASNVDGGSIGEKSTEVSAIYKTEPASSAVGVTTAPAGITVNGYEIGVADGGAVYYAVADGEVDVSVDAPENTNVYINGTYGHTAHFDSLTHRMVRVIVQEGEKEPMICYINLRTSEAQAELDRAAASDTIAKIDGVGDVTVSSGDVIAAARASYDALTKEQKELVTNYNKLLDAEKVFAKLTSSADDRDFEKICHSAGDYIASLGTPGVGSVGGEWAVIGLARNGRDVPSGYYEAVVKYVRENINDREQLHRSKSTDNSRIILALTALGYDVTDIGGHNLLAGLSDMSYIKKQGINGPVWALIAFDSHSYEIPAGDVTRDALVDVILDAQLPGGGWTLSGDEADPDMTAMALQALAPYYTGNEAAKTACENALTVLSGMQDENGGFASWGSVNSESCAQVLVALCALGVDPLTDTRFVKNANTVIDALCSFAVDGGFKHVADGTLNGMATEQGYYALVAYLRFRNGSTSLYDMSDVTVRAGENPDIPVVPDKKPDDNNRGGQTPPSDDNNQGGQTPAPGDNNQGGQTTDPGDNNQGDTSYKPDDGKDTQSPQTGYSTDAAVYTGLMILSFAGIAVTATLKRRKRHE